MTPKAIVLCSLIDAPNAILEDRLAERLVRDLETYMRTSNTILVPLPEGGMGFVGVNAGPLATPTNPTDET